MMLRFDVPNKIKSSVNDRTVLQQYGRENRQQIQEPISVANLQTIVQRQTSTGIENSGNLQQKQIMKRCQRKRMAQLSNSVTLVEGQKWAIAGADGGLPNQIQIRLGWDCLDARCELDASAFLLTQNEKVPSDDWFVFYGQSISPDRSVRYCSYQEQPDSPDDAEIQIALQKVSPQIQKIAICVTIYEAIKRDLHFGMVQNVYARIIDETGIERIRFPMTNLTNAVTALVVGICYRYQNMWKFHAIGSGYRRDLAQFCGIYGVELE